MKAHLEKYMHTIAYTFFARLTPICNAQSGVLLRSKTFLHRSSIRSLPSCWLGRLFVMRVPCYTLALYLLLLSLLSVVEGRRSGGDGGDGGRGHHQEQEEEGGGGGGGAVLLLDGHVVDDVFSRGDGFFFFLSSSTCFSLSLSLSRDLCATR